jgi:hypothetical protein
MKKTIPLANKGIKTRRRLKVAAASLAIGGLMLTTAPALSQTQDTTLVKVFNILYNAKRSEEGKAPLQLKTLKYMDIELTQNPSKKLKIAKGLKLSVEDQKTLLKNGSLETQKHVIYYSDESRRLYAFKKED